LSSIVDPAEVIALADITMEDFEPEGANEEQMFSLVSILLGSAKEKMKHDAIKADR
jgi:hypothetical protein